MINLDQKYRVKERELSREVQEDNWGQNKIIATTGFQHILSRSEMLQVFTDTLKTVTKTIELRMSRLRSAS